MIISCNKIKKSFGVDVILEDINFSVDEREKAAIVGVNGAGKTTIFKILTRELSKDSGDIIIKKDCTLGYLSQMTEFLEDETIFDSLLDVFHNLILMEEEIRTLEKSMGKLSGDELEKTMNRYNRVTHDFEEQNGYEYKSRIRGVIKGLGFTEDESSQTIKTLSGGQKTRLYLGKLLLTSPDILLLDEPTNHLDIDSIRWLEDFLRAYDGSVIVISHDRYFLDKIVSKVIQIENRKSQTFLGNYTTYAKNKEIDRELKLKHFFDQQKEIKKQEETIRILKSFNREKSIKRAESREKLLDKLERVEKVEDAPQKMRIQLSPKRPSGNDVLDVKEIKKSFDDETLFENVNFSIKKGERVALIGPNGVGKTTLFRIILKQMTSDLGFVKEGSNVMIGYYDQEHQNLDMENTIFNEISFAQPNLTNTEIRNTLASFVFTNDDVYKTIKNLSGGEKGRVALAKIMLSNANFLILDEPTNHLDMYSKEILEETLRNYTGTILYISHDRYFINNTAQKILELTKSGVTSYLGNYDYYFEKKNELIIENTVQELNIETLEKNNWKKKKEEQAEERKRKNQLEKIELEISEVENDIQKVEAELCLEKVYTDSFLSKQAYDLKVSYERKLEQLYLFWEELN